MQAAVVRFQREAKGEWEYGISISINDNASGDTTLIVDKEGKPIEEPHNWEVQEFRGCFIFDPNN